MSTEKVMNRWIVVIGAVLIQLALGTIYCWGTLSLFISAGEFLREPREVTVYIFGIGLLSFAITMIFAGKLQQKIGPKKVAMIGAILIGIGVIASAFVNTIPLGFYIEDEYISLAFIGMILTYGVIFGAGIGFGYVCPIACAAKWFPDKKGTINGIAVAGFGAGAFIFNFVIKALASISIPVMFIVIGIIYTIMVIAGALTLINPPAGWKPAGWEPPAPSVESGISGKNYTRGQIIKLPQFWMLWLAFVLSAICGLMTIGAYSSFAKSGNFVVNDLDFLVLVGSLAALFNGVGRIVWGKLSDFITYKKSMMIMFTIQGVLMIVFFFTAMNVLMFLLIVCFIYFCFGGNFSMFPTATSDLFGSENLGSNYGILFTAYGIAGFMGATMVMVFVGAFGGYMVLFILMGIMSFGATAIASLIKPPQ